MNQTHVHYYKYVIDYQKQIINLLCSQCLHETFIQAVFSAQKSGRTVELLNLAIRQPQNVSAIGNGIDPMRNR